jgi:hypothetical protein
MYNKNMNNQCLDNVFAHLTNYSLNKASPNFFVSEDPYSDAGHKRLWSIIQSRLTNEGKDVDSIQ